MKSVSDVTVTANGGIDLVMAEAILDTVVYEAGRRGIVILDRVADDDDGVGRVSVGISVAVTDTDSAVRLLRDHGFDEIETSLDPAEPGHPAEMVIYAYCD